MSHESLLVMLRCSSGELERLDALFGFSLQRALWSLESAASAAARLAVTRGVIAPLERERHNLQRAAVQCQGRGGRLLLPRSTVELIERQWRSLCRVAARSDFDPALLPSLLADPLAGARAFREACGLAATSRAEPLPRVARGIGPGCG